MALIARILMLVTGALLVFYVCMVFVLAGIGEYSEVWDLADFDPQPFAPHPVGLGVAFVFAFLALTGVIMTFWQAHLLLKAGRRHLFLDLERGLRRCGYGLGMMWIGMYFFMNIVPLTMSMGQVSEQEMDVQWAPFEIESCFLVLAVVMIALAGNLRRAAEIEEENSQFL